MGSHLFPFWDVKSAAWWNDFTGVSGKTREVCRGYVENTLRFLTIIFHQLLTAGDFSGTEKVPQWWDMKGWRGIFIALNCISRTFGFSLSNLTTTQYFKRMANKIANYYIDIDYNFCMTWTLGSTCHACMQEPLGWSEKVFIRKLSDGWFAEDFQPYDSRLLRRDK